MMPKRLFGVLPLIVALLVLSSLASPSQAQQAEYNPGGFCNLTPNGASTGNVTLNRNCVIYEDINGTANGDLIISPNTTITLHHDLVFYPNYKITVSPGAKIFVNSDSFIKQGKLCLKIGPSGTYPAVKTVTGNLEPGSGTLITGSALTQIDAQLATFTPPNTFSCNAGYALRETFASLAYVDTGAGATSFSTSDADMLGLGFTINGVTNTLAAAGDIQVDPSKNLILLPGGAGGKLGIGTTTPGIKLTVQGTPGAPGLGNANTGLASFCETTGGNGLIIGTNNSGFIYSWLQSEYCNNISANYSFFVNPLGGNVGIGAPEGLNPPYEKLVVFGNQRIDNATNPTLDLMTDDQNLNGLRTYWNTTGLYGSIQTWYGNGQNHNLSLQPGGGSVGIGTTAPTQALEVNGNLKLSPSNPYLYTGGSYLVIPNGMYISGASIPLYTEARIQARGGISDDTGSNLDLYGGTSGNTQVTGTFGVTAANTVAYPVLITSTASGPMTSVGDFELNDNADAVWGAYGYALQAINRDNSYYNAAIFAQYQGTSSGTSYGIETQNNANSTSAYGLYSYAQYGNAGYFGTSSGLAILASGTVRSSAEFQSTGNNQMRLIWGSYGLIFRQDGTNFYMLPTNASDQYGSWNALRPFSFNMSTGNVGIGNPADNTSKLTVSGCVTASTTGPFAGAGGNQGWTLNFATQNICRSVNASNAIVAGNFYSVSDAREKNNIKPIDPKLVDTFLTNAKPSLFNWKSDGNIDSGFVAQDLIQSGLGYLVSSAADPNMKQDVRNGFTSPAGTRYSVNYNSIIPILTQIAKDQQAKIDNQQKQIDSLNQRLQELENKIK